MRTSLRYWLLPAFAPSLFPGVRFGDWCRLLHENGYRVEPRYGIRAVSISLFSVFNSVASRLEEACYADHVATAPIQPPLFIVGHWRSGTTLLQNLFSLDPRFASPSLYEVLFPHVFLTTDKYVRPLLSLLIPPTRPSDNVPFGLHVPYEDEFAICASSFCSPHVSVVFPHRSQHYDRYLTLRELPEAEVVKWKTSLSHFLRKLSFKYQRPLVLKSPPHTGRIRFLLDLFPNAKFLHMHRHPYAVFQSTLAAARDSSFRQRLQVPTTEGFEDRILRVYRTMYEAFFEDRQLIPRENYHDIRFETFEQDPVAEMKRAYEALSLPSFTSIEPAVQQYCESMRSYRKNQHPSLPEPMRARITAAWQRSFDEWGYVS